jgi:hypothetical protein
MRISPNYTDHDWKVLDLTTESGWQTSVNSFEDRTRSRFVDMITLAESTP